MMDPRKERDRHAAVVMHQQGTRPAQIARELKRSKHFVTTALHREEETGSQHDRPHTGRPKKTTPSVSRRIVGLARGKRHRSTRSVSKIAKRRRIADVSHVTVRKILKEADLHPFHRRVKPRLSDRQKQERVRFARQNGNRDWTNVVFTDEKKFVLFDIPNRHNDVVWAGDPSEVPDVEVEKWKVVVHAWGAISHHGQISLVFYTPPLTAVNYCQILQNNFLSDVAGVFGEEEFVFQQDGAPCHTAASTQRWLQDNVPNFLDKDTWPANSPDLNPIERIWAILVEKLESRRPRTTEGFKKVIREEWQKLSLGTIQAVIAGQGNKMRAVVQSRGCSL